MGTPRLGIVRWGQGVEFTWNGKVWNSDLPPGTLELSAQLVRLLQESRFKRPEGLDSLLSALRASLSQAVPADLRVLLTACREPVAVDCDDPHLNWEWALPVVAFRASGPSPEPLAGTRALFFSDPEGMIPDELERAELCRGALQSSLKTEFFSGPAATLENLHRRLEYGEVSILYLAALAESSPAPHRRSDCRLFLADGPVTLRDLFNLRLPWPGLICLNLASAGPPEAGMRLWDGLETWAGAFLEAGARCVAGTLWDVPEGLPAAFFQELAGGASCARALRKEGGPALTLLGDGAATLAPPPDPHGPTAAGVLEAEQVLRVVDGPGRGREILLYSESLRMGKAVTMGSPGLQVNDIDLEDPQLENRSCSLESDADGLVVVRTGSPHMHLAVNGLKVVAKVPLRVGDMLEVGSTRMRLETPQPRHRGELRSSESPAYMLSVERGMAEDIGQMCLLERGVALVGRLSDCALRLNDPAVSRHHLSLAFRDGLVFATHVGSTQTIINGVPLEETRELQPQDVIQLSSKTFLRFQSSRRRAES